MNLARGVFWYVAVRQRQPDFDDPSGLPFDYSKESLHLRSAGTIVSEKWTHERNHYHLRRQRSQETRATLWVRCLAKLSDPSDPALDRWGWEEAIYHRYWKLSRLVKSVDPYGICWPAPGNGDCRIFWRRRARDVPRT